MDSFLLERRALCQKELSAIQTQQEARWREESRWRRQVLRHQEAGEKRKVRRKRNEVFDELCGARRLNEADADEESDRSYFIKCYLQQ